MKEAKTAETAEEAKATEAAAEEAEEKAAEERAADEAKAAETAEKAEQGADADNAEDPGKENGEEEKKEEVKEEGQEASQEDADRRYLRLMADFQNYKKRAEKEKKDLYAYANENIMGDLLNVLDNFERALEHDPGDGFDGFKEGIEMIFKQLTDVLEKSGLTEIEALGEEFDPNVHSAVMTEETEDYESGKVSGVMQKGYKLNGKVIRPAMVKVAN